MEMTKSSPLSYTFEISNLEHTKDNNVQIQPEILNTQTISTYSGKNIHQDVDNNDAKPFKCQYCEKSFKMSCTLKTHTRIHTGEKPFECSVCNKKFSQSGHLTEHARTHTGEKPYQCTSCGKSYTNGSHLRAHFRSHTGERPYSCSHCGRTFSHLNGLKMHANLHTGGSQYKYPTPDRKNMPKRFSCEVCGSAFKLSHSLKVHLRSHSGEKPFVCQLCSKGFTQAAHLKCHELTHSRHLDVGGGKKNLPARKKKPNSASYRCVTCGATFSHLPALKTHATKHTGEKPFKCGVCSRCFTSQFLLASHMRTHTGEKPYQCEICSKCFAQRSVLICHLRMHKGDKRYACEICSKKFISHSDLVKHTRIHTGVKPYKCGLCSSCFGRSNHLTRHMKIHFGNKKSTKSSNTKHDIASGNEFIKPSQNLNSAYCNTDVLGHEMNNIGSFYDKFKEIGNPVKLNQFNSCYDNSTHILNQKSNVNANLSNGYQTPMVDYHNYVCNNSRISGSHPGDTSILDSFMICDKNVLHDDFHKEHRLNTIDVSHIGLVDTHEKQLSDNFCRYPTEVYDEHNKQNCFNSNLNTRDHFDDRNISLNYDCKLLGAKTYSNYDQIENVYAKLHSQNGEFMREKQATQSFERENKSCDFKNTLKWRYQNSNYCLKASCDEANIKVSENCKKWQCGICDDSFQTQIELTDHVNLHKNNMSAMRYTKLVTNPQSGILEEVQIIPRKKLQIVPKEILQTIVDSYFIDKKDKTGIESSANTADSRITVDVQNESEELSHELNSENLLNSKNYISNNDADNLSKEVDVGGGEMDCEDKNKNEFNDGDDGSSHFHESSDEDDRPLVVRDKTTRKNSETIGNESNLTNKQSEQLPDFFLQISKVKSIDNCVETKCKQKKSEKLKKDRTHVEVGRKEHSCSECLKVFKQSNALMVHMRCHTGERPYQCQFCPRRFAQGGQLKEHSRTHTKERPYQCILCGKVFVNGTHLKSHMKTHTGEKPFECEVCHKRFGHRIGWKLHQNIHTGETPYKCEQCGRGFRQPSSLRSHLRIHTGEKPYACLVCSKSFSQKATLEAHSRGHRGERPHRCSLCPRSFLTSGDKTKHEATHAPDRPFQCTAPLCVKTFKRNAHLKRHMFTHRVVECA